MSKIVVNPDATRIKVIPGNTVVVVTPVVVAGGGGGTGDGDMILAQPQTVTGKKTFTVNALAVKGTGAGVNNITTANTGATSYTNTIPAKEGTFAMTDDITTATAGVMKIADVQSVTGTKKFDSQKIAVKGTRDGVTTLATDNTSDDDFVATLPAKTGKVAYLDDITDTQITIGVNTNNDASTTKHGFAPKATAPTAGDLNVLGIAGGESGYANKTILDTTTPSTQAFGDSASAGTSVKAARVDHKHAMPAAPTTVTGSAGSLKSPDTTGVTQVTGPAAGTTRVKTVSDTNDTMMELGQAQSVTGAKTFNSAALKVKGSSTGVNTIEAANTSGTSYTNTLPAKEGTFAMTSDITGTNSGTNTGDETASRVAAIIDAVATKTSMADADKVTIIDTEASNAMKTLSWSYVKSILKTYFDTVYGAIGAAGDMVLASVQSVTGLKTFDKDKIAMKGTSTGKTVISTANTSAFDYTLTMPAKTGTIATTDDIAAAGGGDVSGPSSATNNHVVVFDGTTGKLIKSSGVSYANFVGLSGEGNVVLTKGSASSTAGGAVNLGSTPGTTGSPTATVADDMLGETRFFGRKATAYSGTAASIKGAAEENFTDSATGSRVVISTTQKGTTTLSERVRVNDVGNVGFGVTAPTGVIHMKAGTTAAGTAPLKFTAGTNMTNAEAGAVEWDGTNVFVTQTSGPTRKTLAYTTDITDAGLTTTDVTTNDASTSKHGFAPKATAPAANALNVVGITNGETVYTNKALLDTTTPSTQNYGDSASAGTSLKAAHVDHKHAMPAAVTDATIATTDVTTNDAGTAKHGWAPKATAPAANALSVVGITNGETVYTNKALLDTTTPSTQAFGDSASAGTSLKAAHADHKHAMPAAPTTVTGSAGSLKSNATTGVMQITGPGAASTRVKTVSDGDDTLMELAATQSVTGAKTFDSSALKMKGSSTGVTTVASANTGASNYTLTMPAETATLDTRTIQVTTITVAATGWTTDGSLKKYQISDSNITANSVVEVIPDNSTIDYVTAAQVLPATSSEAGKVNIWAKTTPTGDFGVTINIKTKA